MEQLYLTDNDNVILCSDIALGNDYDTKKLQSVIDNLNKIMTPSQ